MPEISIKDALNKAFIKARPERAAIETFKGNFTHLLDTIKADPDESEEFLKNLVSDFLKRTWYGGGYFINTKGRMDLVIHNGKEAKSSVGVIIETKKPGNKAEMVSCDGLNAKAMHELLLYYLRETIDNKNIELKHLIITNTVEWFIFDAHEFSKHFSHDKKLLELYTSFKNGSLPEKDTNFFYTQIAAPYIEKNEAALSYVYFNIADDYEAIIRKVDKAADNKLIRLYKILSPEHLLKLPFVNDSNTLNQNFYAELLYIMGLSEEKEGSKKVIGRNKPEDRIDGSLIENIIFQLSDYTLNENELFEIALELTITWINRILFLKLLESQLLQYQKQNSSYSFLNIEKIQSYGELNALFFKVLAQETENRPESVRSRFAHVPHLNSSLFDMSETEEAYFPIANLRETNLPVFSGTVLKDRAGTKRKGPINTLRYIFEFLDAYDFSSEGSEEIQEENKTLINASVLGLIFEKINGYKDGSYFTPGFITTYICRETIRRVVVDKFNEAKNWDADSFDELKNYVDNKSVADIKEANRIINSITVCDPAVGSGHFLVSALNEIIAIKSELGVLADNKGIKLKNCTAEVVNDELMILDEDENFYTYNVKNAESRRIQETIFQEKRRIIEGSLFGVDINPNSVKICRLRLWIELLKNAYYTKVSGYTELETLPNIDINIKCGNSLISRFELDIDLKSELSRLEYTVKDYQDAVYKYKNATAKAEKQDLENLIKAIKNNLRGCIQNNTRLCIKKGTLLNERNGILGQGELFDLSPAEVMKNEKRLREIEQKIMDIDQQIEDIKNNAIYDRAFEWRFEFPELLHDDGSFVGFDVVVGNPPYIPLEALSTVERYFFKIKYYQVERKYETSVLFIIESIKLIKKNRYLSFIAPATWQTGENYKTFRRYIFNNNGIQLIINLPFNTFEEAYVDTSIYTFIKSKSESYRIYNFNKKDKVNKLENLDYSIVPTSIITQPDFKIILNVNTSHLLEKHRSGGFITLGEITKSTQGLSGSCFPEYKKKGKPNKNCFHFLASGNVYNYQLIVNEIYTTDLSDKLSLQQYYRSEPKLLIRRIINRQDRLAVGYCSEKLVFKKDINPFICIDGRFFTLFLLGIMASKYISYLYVNSSSIATKDDFRQTTLSELRRLPIPLVSKSKQMPIVTLVDKILTAKKENHAENTSLLEQKIDKLVYGLYGLTEKEIEMLGKEQ